MQACFDSNTLKITVKASTRTCVCEINQLLEIDASRSVATYMLLIFILDFADASD